MMLGFSPRLAGRGKKRNLARASTRHPLPRSVAHRAAINRENAAIFWLTRPANLPLFAATASGNSASARQRHRWQRRALRAGACVFVFSLVAMCGDGTVGGQGANMAIAERTRSRREPRARLSTTIAWDGPASRYSAIVCHADLVARLRHYRIIAAGTVGDVSLMQHALLLDSFNRAEKNFARSLVSRPAYSASNTSSVSTRPRAKKSSSSLLS